MPRTHRRQQNQWSFITEVTISEWEYIMSRRLNRDMSRENMRRRTIRMVTASDYINTFTPEEVECFLCFLFVFVVCFLYGVFGSDERYLLNTNITGIVIVLGLGYVPLILRNRYLLRTKLNLERKLDVESKQQLEQQEQHGAMLKEIQELKEQSENKDRKNVQLKSQKKELESQKKELESQQEELESQKKKLEMKVAELRKVNKGHQTDKLKLKEQNEKLELKIKKVDKKKRENAEEKIKLLSQITDLELKFKNTKKKNPMLGKEILTLESQNQNLNLQLEKEKDAKLCIICADNDKHILLQPCNHLCLCGECLLHKEWSECPVCRQGIQATVDVYV